MVFRTAPIQLFPLNVIFDLQLPECASFLSALASKAEDIRGSFVRLERSFAEDQASPGSNVGTVSPLVILRWKAVDLLASYAALAMELFHKLAERMLLAEVSSDSKKLNDTRIEFLMR